MRIIGELMWLLIMGAFGLLVISIILALTAIAVACPVIPVFIILFVIICRIGEQDINKDDSSNKVRSSRFKK